MEKVLFKYYLYMLLYAYMLKLIFSFLYYYLGLIDLIDFFSGFFFFVTSSITFNACILPVLHTAYVFAYVHKVQFI